MDYCKTELPKQKWIAEEIERLYGASPELNIVDLGFGQAANPFLRGRIAGVESADVPVPSNYERVLRWNLDETPLPIPPDSQDVVIAGDIIEHLRRPFDLLDDIRRILKPNGSLIITTPNPHYLHETLKSWLGILVPDVEDHLVHFPEANLRQYLMQRGFRVNRMRYYKFWIPFVKIFYLGFGVPSPFGYQYCFSATKVDA